MNTDIDISGVTLKTQRLILRPWCMDDLDDFFEYAKVDGVGQMAGWLPHKNKNETLAVLQNFIKNKKTFAIVKDNKVIGSLGIEKYNEKENPKFDKLKVRELGIVISKDYWGQGIAPEAFNKVIDYLFNELDLDIVMAGYFENNKQSKRFQEKCGFKLYKKIMHTTQFGQTVTAYENIIINPKHNNIIIK